MVPSERRALIKKRLLPFHQELLSRTPMHNSRKKGERIMKLRDGLPQGVFSSRHLLLSNMNCEVVLLIRLD